MTEINELSTLKGDAVPSQAVENSGTVTTGTPPHSLESLTVKELQAKLAKDFNFPNAELFPVKKQLITIITNLLKQATPAQVIPAPVVGTIPTPETVRFNRHEQVSYTKKQTIMRQLLETERPFAQVMLSLEGEEKTGYLHVVTAQRESKYIEDNFYIVQGNELMIEEVGSWHPVTINGCKTLVPKGIMVEVPRRVAAVLSERSMALSRAGRKIRLDRSKDVEDALGG